MADNYKEIVNHLSLFCGNKYAIYKQSLMQENGLVFFIAKDGKFPNEYKVAYRLRKRCRSFIYACN